MRLIPTKISDLFELHNESFADDRGSFSRLFCTKELDKFWGGRRIVQINHSITKDIGSIRGLHYQLEPYAECKIVRCIRGQVMDVAVDLRPTSPTYLSYVSVYLSPQKNNALIIPEGFAHGFQVIEPNSELLYLHSNFYNKDYERGVRFDEIRINISWPLPPTLISEKDLSHPPLLDSFI